MFTAACYVSYTVNLFYFLVNYLFIFVSSRKGCSLNHSSLTINVSLLVVQ